MASMEEGLRPSSCTKIAERVQHRAVFHEHRERALHSPEMARDQLKAYASLRIKIVRAKGLIGSDAGWHRVWDHQKAVSDPYVNIFTDDVFSHRTKTVKCTTNPRWPEEEFLVPVETGSSMIQLQVMDEDRISSDDLLGFVEFLVADLPLGQKVRGWLSLTPKENLQATAPKRLAQAMKGNDLDGKNKEHGFTPHRDKAGSVFVEMTLEIASGEESDEFFAFCLPEPTFVMSPVSGFKRAHEPLDAQAIYNSLHLLIVSSLDGFLRPLQNFVRYIITWREKWLSALVTIVAVVVCIEPLLALGAFLMVHGLVLLLLRSPERRAAMSADPHSAPLNEEGFRLVASLGSSEKMTIFIERVISCMRGKVQDRQRLREFAVFTTEDKRPVVSYAELKRQLREVSELRQRDARFVSFAAKPMGQGTSVATADGESGVVKECVNPKEKHSEWMYKVDFGPPGKEDVRDFHDDDLQALANLRWLANKAVLAAIPDGVEDIFMKVQPPLDQAAQLVHHAAETAHGIVAWKGSISWGLSIGGLVLGFLSIWGVLLGHGVIWDLLQWILKLALIITVLFLHLFFADFMVNLRTHLTASAKSKRYAVKDPTKWPFFTAATPEDDLPPPAPARPAPATAQADEEVKEGGVREGVKSAAGAVKSAAGGAVHSVGDAVHSVGGAVHSAAGRAKNVVGAMEHRAEHLVEGIGHGLGFKK